MPILAHTIEGFLELFEGVRRVGNQFIALCPAHDDRNPSLSIRESGNKILIHCHAGCSREAVGAAVGRTLSDLALEEGPSGSRTFAEYEYKDERGQLLYVVERLDPKGFRQKKPNGMGGWIFKLGDARRVLYRLQEIMYANEVIVLEGEKDVETARKLGFVATCNPGGAGKWRDEYSEVLRGKRVVISPDADEAGRKHVERVAASLAGEVKSLKVIELPAKDLSEWVEKGGTRDELLEIIRSAPDIASPDVAGAQSSLDLWMGIPDVASLAQRQFDYHIEGLFPVGSVILISGLPGTHKTNLQMAAAWCISEGLRFLDRGCEKTYVLVLDRENPQAVIQQRMRLLGIKPSERFKWWGLWNEEEPPVIGDLRLLAIARDLKPVMFFDSLIRFTGDCKEDNASEIKLRMEHVRKLASVGATPVLLHHAPWSWRNDGNKFFRGSVDILAACDVAFSISADAKDDRLLTFAVEKTRYSERFNLKLRAPDFRTSTSFQLVDAPIGNPVDVLVAFVVDQGGQVAAQKIRQRRGIRRETSIAVLKRAIEEGRLIRLKRGQISVPDHGTYGNQVWFPTREPMGTDRE